MCVSGKYFFHIIKLLKNTSKLTYFIKSITFFIDIKGWLDSNAFIMKILS